MATTDKDKRHQPSSGAVNSLRNLWTQMLGALSSPEIPCAPGLREACATQEKLSKFECKALGISPLALNTFKSAAQVAIEKGGWECFDQLRRQVYASSLPLLLANKKVKRSLGSQNSRLRSELEELRGKNQNLLRGRAILLSAYFDVLKTLRESQRENPEIVEKLREHEVRFDIRKHIGGVEEQSD